MKTALKNLMMMFVAVAMVACSAVGAATQTAYEDDLYGVVNRRSIQQSAPSSRQVTYEQVEQTEIAETDSYESILSSGYDDSFERRLRGSKSPNYKTASSYYNAVNSDAVWYAKMYDPAYYNVVFSGNKVWVEPKYVTAMFGNWGASVMIGVGWGSPYWNHWSTCGWNWSFDWTWGYPWSYASYWWGPGYHHWHHHYHFGFGHYYGHRPKYYYGHRYPSHAHRPNHVPNRNYAPVHYGGYRQNSLGNSAATSGNYRTPNKYVPSRGTSSSEQYLNNDRLMQVNSPSYTSSQLLERRRNNSNSRVTESRNTPAKNLIQNVSRVVNQSSSSGSVNRSSGNGGGVNRGRR